MGVHGRRAMAGGLPGGAVMGVKQRHAPAARGQPLGDRAAGQPCADDDGMPFSPLRGGWRGITAVLPGRREARHGHVTLAAKAWRLGDLEPDRLQTAPHKACRCIRSKRGAGPGEPRQAPEDGFGPHVRVAGRGEAIEIERIGAKRELGQHRVDIAQRQRQRNRAAFEFESMQTRQRVGPCRLQGFGER
ncbi:hypothetical protein D3C87_1181450 [compost metagenome]